MISREPIGCRECGAPLVVNRVMVARVEVFCPDEQCVAFVRSFWLMRGSLTRPGVLVGDGRIYARTEAPGAS